MSNLKKQVEQIRAGNPPPEDAGLFGLDLDPSDAKLLIIPAPWEATVSYLGGTSEAPEAIVKASHQLDLSDPVFGEAYAAGISFSGGGQKIADLNRRAARLKASGREVLTEINGLSAEVNQEVESSAREWLAKGKHVALLGGDHSCPYGLIKALADHTGRPFGILHVDAHHDLRAAYEGYIHSHASIMYNVLTNIPQVVKLMQVGIRDYSADERDLAARAGGRCEVFYDYGLARQKFSGTSFGQIATEIVDKLPERVYVSFDIDGLDQGLCPSTGTPVPGGLQFNEACYLLELLATRGREIIGFDLVEVVPARDGRQWDENVAARILYKLCGALLRSNKWNQLEP